MKWMHKKGCPFGYLTCSRAAKFNHLESLRFLREELNPPCPWNESTCITAAEFGRLECLKYALSNACYTVFSKDLLDKMLIPAAENGYVNCFRYVFKWVFPTFLRKWTNSTMGISDISTENAPLTNRFKIRTDTLPDTWFKMIHWIEAAATNGQKGIKKWLHYNIHMSQIVHSRNLFIDTTSGNNQSQGDDFNLELGANMLQAQDGQYEANVGQFQHV